MLKLLCILLLGTLSLTNAYAQKEKLFFINGQYHDTNQELSYFMMPPRSSGMDEEQIDRYYNSCLYKLEGDSLAPIDTFAHFQPYDYKNNEYLMAIRLYQDKNTAFVYTSRYSDKKDTVILREVNFKEPYKIKTYKFWENNFYRYWVTCKSDTLYFIDENVSKDSSWLTQRKFYSNQVTNTPYSVLNNYISDGYNGLGCDDLYGGWGTNTERLMLVRKAFNNDTSYMINFTNARFYLPLSDEILKLDSTIERITPDNKFIALTVSNNNMRIIPRRPKKINSERYCQFLIYNKASKQWNSKLLKGSYRAIRAFNSWITGNQIYIGRLGINGESDIGKEVPGNQFRNQEYTEYTSPADFRFTTLGIYPTGILYLYNIDTDNYIEWQAAEEGQPQGDSEILLVKNDTVYYRVNDKIYKRAIINGPKLGERVLLVQDNRVPSIHWAFIAME